MTAHEKQQAIDRIIRWRRSRVTLSAAAGVLIALSLAIPASAVSSPAAAESAKKAPSVSQGSDPVISAFVKTVGAAAIRNQNALEAFRVWMFAQPGFAGSGYVGSIDHLAQKATTIMWHGPRTALLTAIIREGKRRGIVVTVQHRKYSLPQIKAAMAAVWKQAAEGKWAGFKISEIVGVSATDTGLTVEGTYTAVAAARRAPQVRSLAATVQGVAVHVKPGIRTALSIGRDTDISPFNSGDLMVSQSTGDICSSGFAVTIGGFHYTETARHCNEADFVDVNDYGINAPADQRYGTTLELSTDGGARVLTGAGFYQMYHGPWNSTSSSTVIGYGPIGVGDSLCTEGGNSGEHCNIIVTHELVQINDGYGALDVIEGHENTRAAIAVMQGDSGGPVMSLVNTQGSEVRASGMIQAGTGSVYGSGPAECGPAYTYGPSNNPNLCFDNVLFTSEYTIVKNLQGASPYTG